MSEVQSLESLIHSPIDYVPITLLKRPVALFSLHMSNKILRWRIVQRFFRRFFRRRRRRSRVLETARYANTTISYIHTYDCDDVDVNRVKTHREGNFSSSANILYPSGINYQPRDRSQHQWNCRNGYELVIPFVYRTWRVNCIILKISLRRFIVFCVEELHLIDEVVLLLLFVLVLDDCQSFRNENDDNRVEEDVQYLKEIS